jgi:hypothetical protein
MGGGRFEHVDLGESIPQLVQQWRKSVVQNLQEMIEDGTIFPEMTIEELIKLFKGKNNGMD